MSLSGKTIVITGSTSGIGLGIAERFASEGLNIVLNGFGDEGQIKEIEESLRKKGAKTLYHGADMRNGDEIKDLIDQAAAKFGTVDILVNNAGIQKVSPIEDFPIDKWNDIQAINLSSAFHTVRACVPLMKKSGWGRIINIASAHGLVASPYKSAYVAAKHGIIGFTKSIALEVAQDNITVNAICPGYVKTPLVENQIADTAKARGMSEEEVIKTIILAAQWTKKFVTVEQIAETALFLCGNAAENMTGGALTIDGGWTAA